MGGYLLLAIGLINLRYQTGQDNNLVKSLTLVIPGALLLITTFTGAGRNLLQKKAAATIVITLGGLLVLYSFIN